MAAPPPPPRRPCRPPELMDELVEEIFLRLPPAKPSCLVHAALVCKRWCRLVTDPGFRRRFRQFHRTPPMLGLVICSHERANATRFFSTTSFHPSGEGYRSWSSSLLDARHGRILCYYNPVLSNPQMKELTVWTPLTGEVRKLPRLQLLNSHYGYWDATVLCGAPGCDHMECPSGGPFNVVLVGRIMFERFTHAYVYSSAANEWSQQASTGLKAYVKQHGTGTSSAALVRNAVYFVLGHYNGIVEYDLAKKELSVIELPPICELLSTNIMLMSVEDDGLGFAMVDYHYLSLCVWLRESAPTPNGGWTWTQHRVVDLRSFLPVSALSSLSYILAAADAVGVFVISSAGQVFTIDLKSGRGRKVPDANGSIRNIIPYISFCTPGDCLMCPRPS